MSFQHGEISMGEGVSEQDNNLSDTEAQESEQGNGERAANERVELLIHELRKRTAELEEANRELRRVSHYRSLFLARMSHELRTPLTSILGFSEILLDHEQLTETQRRFCQKVQDSGFQLQASLNQLVDLSRIEAGETEVFLQEFSFREALRECCAAVARMAQKQQVRIDYELSPEITTVVSDQGKLRQILFNFVAWAVSRSPSGEAVKISVTLTEPNLLNVRVLDTGIAIEDPAQVFDPEDRVPAREPNINELGIIIGRKLVDLMGGDVTLINRESGGLESHIQLPARPLKG
jgi:signal transduction histidine kinase